MKKRTILINILTDKLQESDFECISKPFKKFEIFNFQFSINEMFPDILEAALTELTKEATINIKRDLIIFQTNIPDLAHFSSKFYSEYIDGVIIYPVHTEYLYKNDKNNVFLLPIIKCDNKNFRIKKVYTHFIYNIDDQYLEFLNDFQLFNEVCIIEQFEILTSKKMTKNINFNLGESVITSDIPQVRNTVEVICHLNEISSKSEYDYLETASSFFFAFNYTTKTKIHLSMKEDLFIKVFNSLKKETQVIAEFKEYIELYLNNYFSNLPINEFATFNYLSILLKDSQSYARQYDYLKSNLKKLDVMQAHALVTNSYFYETKLNVNRYNNLFKDRLEVRSEIISQFKGKIKIPQLIERNDKNIAIVAGQLLSPNHSPTKWVLDYANNFKKYNPELNIKIFVEDWANYSPNELVWNLSYSSAFSSSEAHMHKEYLDASIEVYYSDATLNRVERIQEDVNVICDFEPNIIFKVGSKYNIATDILFSHYPVVSQTISGAEDSQFVDIFTGGYEKEVMKLLFLEQKLGNIHYIQHQIGIETPKKIKEKNREEYNLEENSFVIVTVGNRLDTEITLEFIEQIILVLKNNKNVQWVIVGTPIIELIKNNFLEFVDSNQIVFVSYEKNLFDLYFICDAYLNPVRRTGGNSAALAMKAKLPVITSDSTSDVGHFVGQEHCIDLEDFSIEIERLINNKKYYLFKSNCMLERIENDFSFLKTIRDLKSLFKITEEKFEHRKSVFR